jgi:hypothetical protein
MKSMDAARHTSFAALDNEDMQYGTFFARRPEHGGQLSKTTRMMLSEFDVCGEAWNVGIINLSGKR